MPSGDHAGASTESMSWDLRDKSCVRPFRSGSLPKGRLQRSRNAIVFPSGDQAGVEGDVAKYAVKPSARSS